MRTSESVKHIYTSMIKAVAEIETPKKTTQGYGYKYAPLDEVLDKVRPVLNKYGLALIQTPVSNADGCIGVETRLIHESGEWIEESYMYKPAKLDPQVIGSIITYLRRYSVMALLEIAPEDDDGHIATNKTQSEQPGNTQESPRHNYGKNTGMATDKQKAALRKMVNAKDPDAYSTINWDKLTFQGAQQLFDKYGS